MYTRHVQYTKLFDKTARLMSRQSVLNLHARHGRCTAVVARQLVKPHTAADSQDHGHMFTPSRGPYLRAWLSWKSTQSDGSASNGSGESPSSAAATYMEEGACSAQLCTPAVVRMSRSVCSHADPANCCKLQQLLGQDRCIMAHTQPFKIPANSCLLSLTMVCCSHPVRR